MLLLLICLAMCAHTLPIVENGNEWVSLRVGTWNIMQQPWLTRWTQLVLNSLGNAGLDVLVLQEVWTDEIRDAIITNKGVSKEFSFFYSPAKYQKQVGCDFTDPILLGYASEFVQCLQQTGTNLTQIIQPYDRPVYPLCDLAGIQVATYNSNTTNFQCLACIINSLQSSRDWQSKCGSGTGDAHSYHGTNGILVLSKFKIRNITETRFNSWLVNRVNIHVSIKGITMTVGHFAYNLLTDVNPIYTPYMFGDVQAQQAIDMLQKKSDVVLGDFNSGPGYQPDGYNLLVDNGYVSTFANITSTYCINPSFKMCKDFYGKPYPPQAIDHILVHSSNKLRFPKAEVFNAYPLMSDHVGVRTVISKLTSERD